MSAPEGNGRPEITRFSAFESLPELLTPEEFAAYTGLGRTTVYELCRRSEIQHLKFGRLLRIPRTTLARIPEASDHRSLPSPRSRHAVTS